MRTRNDHADRDLDAHRPERPTSPGAISASTGLAVATGPAAAGLDLAALAGRRTAPAAAPLQAVLPRAVLRRAVLLQAVSLRGVAFARTLGRGVSST